MKDRVIEALEKIRPALQADGGDVVFIALVGNVVQVRLQGACSGCPMANVTLKNGIERVIKEAIPEIESVEAV